MHKKNEFGNTIIVDSIYNNENNTTRGGRADLPCLMNIIVGIDRTACINQTVKACEC